VRRRERVIRIFPNRPSSIRLLGALLMEQDEQWSTGKRSLDMTTYWQWRAAQATQSTPPFTEGGQAPSV
jgi:putative transposase